MTGLVDNSQTLSVTPRDYLSQNASHRLIFNEQMDVNYKGHKLQLYDLIEMRLLLVDKIEQIISQASREEAACQEVEFKFRSKKNIFDDMVSFFLAAKLEESLNDQKSMTSTIKETEYINNKSDSPSEKPLSSRNTFLERKMYSSVDVLQED